MSATIDLAGGTVTLTTDSTTNAFQVTDTTGGGELVFEAGAILEFDDEQNAGFLASAVAYTITINGNSSHECEIKSINRYPDHRWTVPDAATITTFTATQCTFTNYQGSWPSSWTYNNCQWTIEPYAYCTANEIENLTGTTLGDAILAEIIGQASSEVNSRLSKDGIVPSGSDAILAAITRKKAMAGVFRRMIADGTRMGAIEVDGHSTSDPFPMIRELEDSAEKMLGYYVIANLPSTRKRLWVQKVNENG